MKGYSNKGNPEGKDSAKDRRSDVGQGNFKDHGYNKIRFFSLFTHI